MHKNQLWMPTHVGTNQGHLNQPNRKPCNHTFDVAAKDDMVVGKAETHNT